MNRENERATHVDTKNNYETKNVNHDTIINIITCIRKINSKNKAILDTPNKTHQWHDMQRHEDKKNDHNDDNNAKKNHTTTMDNRRKQTRRLKANNNSNKRQGIHDQQ